MAAVDAYSQYAHAGYIIGSGPDLTHGNGKAEDTWYRFRLRFPTGYKPTPGTQNAVFEFHVDNKTEREAASMGQTAYSLVLLVEAGGDPTTLCPGTPSFCTTAGTNPRLFIQVPGGRNSDADVSNVKRYYPFAANSLRINHWYDMTLHVYWSPDSSVGHVQWWVDGTKAVDVFTPTLYLRNDGTYSYGENIQFNNYRRWANWASSVDGDELVWGPTLASVSG